MCDDCSPPISADSIARADLPITSDTTESSLHRRLTYLMAFRVLLITLVLGSTTLLYWLGDVDLTEPNSVILYAIVGITYLLTLVYALALKRASDQGTLAAYQLALDLVIATVIVHVTGGAQSAYTFFYPLAVIGSAVVRYRKGAIVVSIESVVGRAVAVVVVAVADLNGSRVALRCGVIAVVAAALS